MEAELVNGRTAEVLPPQALPAPELRHHDLEPKEQQYFQRMFRLIADVNQQMRGALQLIAEKRGITGFITGLTEDATQFLEKPNP